MKTLLTTLRLAASAIVLSFTLSGCFVNISGLDNIVGNGNITTEKRTITTFTGVSNQISADVDIICKQTPGLEITADENLLPYIRTEIVNGVLTISSDRVSISPRRLTIKASTDMLTNAQISGSGSMTVTGIDTQTLTGRISGSGNMTLIGKVTNGNYTVSGSGNIDAKSCTASEVAASISGSGNISVAVSQLLDGSISGSGSIIYFGNPTIRRNISGSGNIVGGR
ncbi:MAG: DUF2807 domain-containing protein [Ignavibacteria bacterium]|nr:DUF2807 domain-containing protein [Ignavibacteria bacterium]